MFGRKRLEKLEKRLNQNAENGDMWIKHIEGEINKVRAAHALLGGFVDGLQDRIKALEHPPKTFTAEEVAEMMKRGK